MDKAERLKHGKYHHFDREDLRVVAVEMEKGTWHDLGLEEATCYHSHCAIDQSWNTVQKEQDMEVGVEVLTIFYAALDCISS